MIKQIAFLWKEQSRPAANRGLMFRKNRRELIISVDEAHKRLAEDLRHIVAGVAPLSRTDWLVNAACGIVIEDVLDEFLFLFNEACSRCRKGYDTHRQLVEMTREEQRQVAKLVLFLQQPMENSETSCSLYSGTILSKRAGNALIAFFFAIAGTLLFYLNYIDRECGLLSTIFLALVIAIVPWALGTFGIIVIWMAFCLVFDFVRTISALPKEFTDGRLRMEKYKARVAELGLVWIYPFSSLDDLESALKRPRLLCRKPD